MKIKIGDNLPGSELFYLDQNNEVKKSILQIFVKERPSF